MHPDVLGCRRGGSSVYAPFSHGIAENVRMAANHLVRKRVDDVGDGKLPDFGCELRMEENLQQQVTEFFAETIEL